MFLSGSEDVSDLAQPVIVVFGGTVVALLATFPIRQLGVALQSAVYRGIRGGTAPEEMVRAMLKVCDISRRDGLLGVADVRTNSDTLSDACYLISQAAENEQIRFNLEKQRSGEMVSHRLTTDVFMFTAVYSVLIGALGSIIRVVSAWGQPAIPAEPVGIVALPLICGVTLALLMAILVGRLRTAHLRELLVIDIAYRGVSILLEDNNVQRLRARLAALIPGGLA